MELLRQGLGFFWIFAPVGVNQVAKFYMTVFNIPYLKQTFDIYLLLIIERQLHRCSHCCLTVEKLRLTMVRCLG